MARSLQQPDSEVDWNFSERCLKIVKSVAREAEFRNTTVYAEDIEQDLFLWLALRKKARERWENGDYNTLYRNIRRQAFDIVKSQLERESVEIMADDSYWTHGESEAEEEWG